MIQHNTVLMDLKNGKTSDPYRLVLNLVDKINLKTHDRYIPLSNLTLNLPYVEEHKNMK